MRHYYVYILECSDKTFYTGWTNNIEKKIQEHNNGKCGAKYTRTRRIWNVAIGHIKKILLMLRGL